MYSVQVVSTVLTVTPRSSWTQGRTETVESRHSTPVQWILFERRHFNSPIIIPTPLLICLRRCTECGFSINNDTICTVVGFSSRPINFEPTVPRSRTHLASRVARCVGVSLYKFPCRVSLVRDGGRTSFGVSSSQVYRLDVFYSHTIPFGSRSDSKDSETDSPKGVIKYNVY